jgi:LPS sulfotransferase NodH
MITGVAMHRYSEVELSSALLDQPPCAIDKKIFICSTQRTGSFFLCRAMIHYGFGVPHEYFHPLHAQLVGARLGIEALRDPHRNTDLLTTTGELRTAYIGAVTEHRTLNGIFAAKVMWGELSNFLLNAEGLPLLQDAHFIYLHRESLLDQAISLHLATLTGRWGFDDVVTTTPAQTPVFFDNDAIGKHLRDIASQNMSWRLFFGQNGISPLVLAYESLTENPGNTLKAIATKFGLPGASRNFDYREERSAAFSDPQVPSAAAIKEVYLRERQQVRPAP